MTDPGRQPSTDEAPAHSPTRREFRVDDVGLSKDSWAIVVTDSRMMVRNAAGDKTFDVPHAEHFQYMDLVESGNRLMLVLRQDTRVVIQVETALYDALDQWRGDSTEAWLRHDLRGSLIKLIVGLLFIGPALADVGRYFRDGRAFGQQSWEGLVLGALMLAIVALTHFKPHRFVILMDVAWWIGLLLFHAPTAIRNPDLWTLFWVAFPILFGYLRYRMYWKHACRAPERNGVG